jgi:pyrophosphatase PpaX
MKKYQYILFDWDGCLAKTLDIWLDAYVEAYGTYGVFPPRKEIATHFNKADNPRYFGIENWEECIEKVYAIIREKFKTTALYDGAKELLQTLSPHKKMALISGSERYILEWGIQHNHLENMFQVIIGGDEVKKLKPDPEIFEKALSLLGAEKDQTVVIGDSSSDLIGANNTGLDSILIYPPSHALFYDLNHLKSFQPKHIVSDFRELEKILL